MKISSGILSILVLLSFFSCKQKDHPIAKETPMQIDSIAKKYYTQYLKFYPIEATSQGKLAFNSELNIPFTKENITKESGFYGEILGLLKKLSVKDMSEREKLIYYTLDYSLKDKIQGFSHHNDEIPFTQFIGLPLEFPLMGSGEGIQPFKTKKDYENWLSRMEKFPAWMDAAEDAFRRGLKSGNVLPKILVQKMITQMNSDEIVTKNIKKNIFYKPILSLPDEISSEDKQKITAQYESVILSKIIPAYKDMGKFLETEYLPGARITHGLYAIPKGREAYEYAVKSWTTTQLKPEEIYQMGLREVEMLSKQMLEIQASMHKTGSLRTFLNELKTDPKAMPYKTSKEVLDAFAAIQQRSAPGVKLMFKNQPKTSFQIKQTEKFREKTASAEYVQGSPDGSRPGIFYIPLPEPSKFNITSGMESLFLHEAIPGHHFQISLQQENTSLPEFMRFSWINAYGEGWAHYTETLGFELGLYQDPYQKMGYLSDQMLRAVRLVIDTGIHTGRMSREDGIAYFLDHVSYDEASATAEVERYMSWPGQALGYKIGSLKILELREKTKKRLGGRFSLAAFHQRILESGCIPLSILEERIAEMK